MSDYKKALYNFILGLGSLVSVSFLWRLPVLLVLVLVILSLFMLAIRKDMRSFTVYFIGFIFGPLAEIIAISKGAWTYTDPVVLGIPIWLPFLWANAALFIVNTEKLSHILFQKKSK